MPKRREGKDDEFYKGTIREQRKIIKQLKQRIKQLEKETLLKEDTEEEPVIEELKHCLACGKGFIKEIEIVGRIFETCTLCPYRKKIR